MANSGAVSAAQPRTISHIPAAAAPPASAPARHTAAVDGLDGARATSARSGLVADTKDAKKILDLSEGELSNASLDQRLEMLDSVEERKGYWTGFAGVLGFIFVDLLLLGFIWNKRGIAYSVFSEKDREAVAKILTTTPEQDTAELVNRLTASGLRSKLEYRVSGEAEARPVSNFFKMNIHGLPSEQIARELGRGNYDSNEAAAVLSKVSRLRSNGVTNEVAMAMFNNGAMERYVREPFDDYSSNEARRASDILTTGEVRSRLIARYATDQESVRNNPIYRMLPANGSAKAAIDARFEATHDVETHVRNYDPRVAAQSALKYTGSLDELAQILRKTKEVVGNDYFMQLAENIAQSPAYRFLSPYVDYSYNPGRCSTEEDYRRIEYSLDNFNSTRSERTGGLVEFLSKAGLQGTPIAKELQLKLARNLDAVQNRSQQIKAECRAQVTTQTYQDYQRQVRELSSKVQSLNTDLDRLQTKRTDMPAGPDRDTLDREIDRVRSRRDEAQGELRSLQNNPPRV